MPSSPRLKRSSDLVLHLYNGSGNRFLIVDARREHFPYSLSQVLCNKFEVDGIVLLQTSITADHRMTIINADGSEAEMCGNGLRCLMQFLLDRGISEKTTTFETLDGIYSCHPQGDEISIRMRAPKVSKFHLPFEVGSHSFDAAYLELGVPHLILFFEQVDLSLMQEAYSFANQKPSQFLKGTNVSGVQILPGNTFLIRTIERGIGRETGACGTGATAAALAISKRFGFSSPLTAIPLSRDPLKIFFSWEDERPWSIFLTGSAQRELSVNYPSVYNAQA